MLNDVDRPAPSVGTLAQLTAIVLVGAACAGALVSQQLLPERFFYDHNHIVWVMTSPMADAAPTGSFRNTAAFYSVMGLSEHPILTALLTVMVFTVTVFVAARWSDMADYGLIGIAVIGVCFLCAPVYLAQYSKESMTLLLVLIFMALPRGKLAEGVFIGLVIAYAVFYRPYWAIVAGLYVVWRLFFKKARSPAAAVVVIVVFYVLLEILFRNALGIGLTDMRTTVNDGRADETVGSLIEDPLPSSFSMVPSAMVSLAWLIIPFPLFLGSPFHALSGLMIAFLWLTALRQIFRNGRGGGHAGAAAATPSGMSTGRELRAGRASALLLALVMVQAVFEPDYGSYLKHLTPLLPLFLTLVPRRPPRVAVVPAIRPPVNREKTP